MPRVTFEPVTVMFNQILASYNEVVSRLDIPLSMLGTFFRGDYDGLIRTNGLFKGAEFIRGQFGEKPNVRDPERFDAIVLPARIEWARYRYDLDTFLIMPSKHITELALAFDSDKFLNDLGEPWLVGLMTNLMAEYGLNIGLFDAEEDRIGQYSVSTEGTLEELLSEDFKKRKKPRAIVVRSTLLEPAVIQTIARTGCSIVEVEGGFNVVSWL